VATSTGKNLSYQSLIGWYSQFVCLKGKIGIRIAPVQIQEVKKYLKKFKK